MCWYCDENVGYEDEDDFLDEVASGIQTNSIDGEVLCCLEGYRIVCKARAKYRSYITVDQWKKLTTLRGLLLSRP